MRSWWKSQRSRKGPVAECELRAQQLFVQHTQYFSPELWELLFESTTTDAVYLFFPALKTSRLCTAEELPWFVQFILGVFNKKHVFLPRVPPPVSCISKSLALWTNKVRWKYHMHDRENPYSFLRTRGNTRPCEQEMDCFSERFEAEFSSEALNAPIQSRHRFFRLKDPSRLRLRLVNVAVHWLKQRHLTVLPTDKDGGFAVVNRGELDDEIMRVLNTSNFYKREP